MFFNENEKLSKLTPDRRQSDRGEKIVVELKNSKSNSDCRWLESLLAILFIISVIPGIVISGSIWSKILCVVFFPYSYYVFIEKILILSGLY